MSVQQDWLETDYYKTLEVASEATEKEIAKAYRKQARKYHPDTHPDDNVAEEKFKELSAAYEVLGDSAKRKEYDEFRKLGPRGGFSSPRGGRGPAPGSGFGPSDLSDILGGLFGGNGGSTGGGGHSASLRRGDDLETDLHISFDEAVAGVTTSVNVTADVACSICRGSGAAPGSVPDICKQCNGRGVLDDNQGVFSFSQPCDRCGGRGRIVTNPCSSCSGMGLRRKAGQVRARIPAGVKNGQKIRLKGRGAPGRNGGVAGDLMVNVGVEPHKFFGRSGNNLTIKVPIGFAEAALGSKLKVPTMDGGKVTLKIPAGTPSGMTFRVKKKGIETKSKVGDLLVTVEVAVPTELTKEQKKAVEALAVAMPDGIRDHLASEMI